LKTGFHRLRIPWGHNADHQPVGGKFTSREHALAAGCVLASYITFDISFSLLDPSAEELKCPHDVVTKIVHSLAPLALRRDEIEAESHALWPAMVAMKRRDMLYKCARDLITPGLTSYFRELSIDELPGLTSTVRLATALAACSVLDMSVNFIAPAFGFQKNFPFSDGEELQRRVGAAWPVCRLFNCSIGFHSGSGKSFENYSICGAITNCHLEIKTSGRYTYEMGCALAASSDASDAQLWLEWYAFTTELALNAAFPSQVTIPPSPGQTAAHSFLEATLKTANSGSPVSLPDSRDEAAKLFAGIKPNPDHMHWFEYNFLFVLASGGRCDLPSLGDHTQAGLAQRARFYGISAEAKLGFMQRVADYILFLAESTGLRDGAAVSSARERLHSFKTLSDILLDIKTI